MGLLTVLLTIILGVLGWLSFCYLLEDYPEYVLVPPETYVPPAIETNHNQSHHEYDATGVGEIE